MDQKLRCCRGSAPDECDASRIENGEWTLTEHRGLHRILGASPQRTLAEARALAKRYQMWSRHGRGTLEAMPSGGSAVLGGADRIYDARGKLVNLQRKASCEFYAPPTRLCDPLFRFIALAIARGKSLCLKGLAPLNRESIGRRLTNGVFSTRRRRDGGRPRTWTLPESF